MKLKELVCAVGFLLSFSFAGFCVPAEIDDRGIISTSGEAKIWIEPDSARIFLGIETMEASVDAARDENAAKISRVMSSLEALRIADMLIKAPSYNVSLIKEQEYDATRAGRIPKIIGYKVSQHFTVLLKNKDMSRLSQDVARVIDAALGSGVNIMQQVVFFKEDDSSQRLQVLQLAVQDAINNAEEVAKTASLSIKKITMINTNSGYWQPYQMNQLQMTQALSPRDAGGEPTTIVAGKIAVTCRVQLQCRTE
jgi:hypothetical protein